MEWSSFGTNARWGQNDNEKNDAPQTQFILTKVLRPWRYPVESYLAQQGLCGFGYIGGGLNWHAVRSIVTGHIHHADSPIKSVALVIQGALCVGAPIIQNCLKEREGWRHPRTLSSTSLFLSSIALAIGAYQLRSKLLGVASFLFMISTGLPGISRREKNAPSQPLTPSP